MKTPLLFCLFLVCAPSLGKVRHSTGKRWINSSKCVEQCEVVQSCTRKVNRPEMARTLCHILACESGKFCGKKEVRSPSGEFHGPFQFIRGTWGKICKPLLKAKGIAGCSGKKAIYDSCCTSMCAAELIAENINGGIRNWPVCGPAAQREVASESKF